MTFPEAVIATGGYNQIMIGLASGDNSGMGNTYYLDRIGQTHLNNVLIIRIIEVYT